MLPITPPSQFVIAIDTREPFATQYDFNAYSAKYPHTTQQTKLETGDYSVIGLEDLIAIERKTLNDFVQSLKQERFWEELERARKLERFIIVIESDMRQIELGSYRGKTAPGAVFGAITTIIERFGYPVLLAGNRQQAALLTIDILSKFYKTIIKKSKQQ